MRRSRSHDARHHLRRVCGTRTHHLMCGETTSVGLNMACIEGVDVHALGEVEVGDGRNGWSLVQGGEAGSEAVPPKAFV